MKTWTYVFGVLTCLGAAACGDDSGDPAGTGGTPGSGGVVGSGGGGAVVGDACDLDLNDVPAPATPISFENDVMPILGLSCNGGSCHFDRNTGRQAGLILGPQCKYDPSAAPWECAFPTTPPEDPEEATIFPLTQAEIDIAYANLMADATTVTGAKVKRVDPGNPAGSFLLHKLSDSQSAEGYVCSNQDTGQADCGLSMPLNGDPLCRQTPSKGTGARKYTAIAQWIQAGAPKN